MKMGRFFEILRAIRQFLPILSYLFIMRPYHFYAYYFDRPAYFRAGSSVGKFVLYSQGVKLSVLGTEFLPKSNGRYLIIANHQSFLDIPIILAIFPAALVQRFVSYLPGFSWHFGKVSLIIDKNHPLTILRATRYVKKTTIEQGVPVAFFPEGTRSVDGTVGEINPGAATIAKTLNLPILPVTIYNSRDVLPKGAITSRPATVLVGIQPLIDERFISDHSTEEINREIKQRLQNGMDNLAQKRVAS